MNYIEITVASVLFVAVLLAIGKFDFNKKQPN